MFMALFLITASASLLTTIRDSIEFGEMWARIEIAYKVA